jgi:hypothetical protein
MELSSLGLFAAFIVIWIVLNRWILPWLGVPTCMSGGCRADGGPAGRHGQAARGRQAEPLDRDTQSAGSEIEGKKGDSP